MPATENVPPVKVPLKRFFNWPLTSTSLPALAITLPVFENPLPADTIVRGVDWLAMTVPALVKPIGFESPILPEPSMVLLFVRLLVSALPNSIWTVPVPVSVVGELIARQPFASARVPVLLIVPFRLRVSPLATLNRPALVTVLVLPSRVPLVVWKLPVPLVVRAPPETVPAKSSKTVDPFWAVMVPTLLFTVFWISRVAPLLASSVPVFTTGLAARTKLAEVLLAVMVD